MHPMDRFRLSHTIINYQPAGKVNPGRPLKTEMDHKVPYCQHDDDYDGEKNEGGGSGSDHHHHHDNNKTLQNLLLYMVGHRYQRFRSWGFPVP